MAEIKLKKREEMDPAYCWDLSSLFGSDEEFEKTEQELAKKIEAFRAKQGTMKESAEALYDVLSGLDDISRVFSSLYVYASQKYHQDMGNQKYQGYAGKMDSMMAVLADASSFVEPEILELDEETVTEFEKASEPLRLYDRILKENFRKKEHILSPEMEAVLAKAGEMASSPDQIFSAFSNADLRFQPVTDEEENQVPLSHGTFVGFLQSKDRRVRKEAFEKYYAEYEKHKNMLAATFGANLKQAAFFADVRKYPSALAASLDGGNIPVSVYDKLLEAIHAKMPAMYRYVALRKKLLGVDELHMYDVYVSLTKEYEQKYTYEQAIEIVKKALAVLGDDYVALLDKGFSERWVDVYENEGKKSGAYSWGSYDSHPYVLMSFDGTLNSVLTLAHEMGHSIHSWYSNANQSYTYAGYRIFVAEVASTCNEILLLNYMINEAKDRKEKFYLVNQLAERFRTTLFRQALFAEFEWETYKLSWNGTPLTKDLLCGLYHELNSEYYGKETVIDSDIDHEWERIPHFYMQFYVYQYATGFSAAMAIARRILAGDTETKDGYFRFLKGGCSRTPVELLKLVGLDMEEPEVVNEAVKVFKDLLDEMEELA